MVQRMAETHSRPASRRTRPHGLRATSSRKSAASSAASNRRQPDWLCRPPAAINDAPRSAAKPSNVQLHAQSGQCQALARPPRLGVERIDRVGQDGTQLVRRDVVDHQPRPQHQQPEDDAHRVKRQQEKPDVRAEPRCRREGKEQFHRPDDDQPRDGQSQRGGVPNAGDQHRTPRKTDRPQQAQIDRHGAQSQAQAKRIHFLFPARVPRRVPVELRLGGRAGEHVQAAVIHGTVRRLTRDGAMLVHR